MSSIKHVIYGSEPHTANGGDPGINPQNFKIVLDRDTYSVNLNEIPIQIGETIKESNGITYYEVLNSQEVIDYYGMLKELESYI